MLALVTNVLALVASKHSLQPALKLRGGLGGIDSAAVAKGASYLLVTNGVLCGLGPDKACEGYGLDTPSFTTAELVKSLGYVQGSMAILALTSLAGMPTPKAIAWASVPLLLQTIENLLNDVPAKMGMPAGGMVLLLAINAATAYCGFYGVGPEWVFKAYAAWSMANGAFFALSPKAGAKAWGIEATETEAAMMKNLGYMLVAWATLAGALLTDVPAVTGVGYAWVVALASIVDGAFISKTMDAMMSDLTPMYVWMAIQAAVIGGTLF